MLWNLYGRNWRQKEEREQNMRKVSVTFSSTSSGFLYVHKYMFECVYIFLPNTSLFSPPYFRSLIILFLFLADTVYFFRMTDNDVRITESKSIFFSSFIPCMHIMYKILLFYFSVYLSETYTQRASESKKGNLSRCMI